MRWTAFTFAPEETANDAAVWRRSWLCRYRHNHDLRHTFAVTTMIDWYRDGQDVQVRLPLLSTWLGHVDPASTYWYLHAVPELLAHAAHRLDAHAGSDTTESAS